MKSGGIVTVVSGDSLTAELLYMLNWKHYYVSFRGNSFDYLELFSLSAQRSVILMSAASFKILLWGSHRRMFLSSVRFSSAWWTSQIWVKRKMTCNTLRGCWRSTRRGRELKWESWMTAAKVAAQRRNMKRQEPDTETPSSPGSWRRSHRVLSRSCGIVVVGSRSLSLSHHPTWLRWFQRVAPAEDPGLLSCSWCRLWSVFCRGRTAALKQSWSLGRWWFIPAGTAVGQQDQDQLWRNSALFRRTPTSNSLNNYTELKMSLILNVSIGAGKRLLIKENWAGSGGCFSFLGPRKTKDTPRFDSVHFIFNPFRWYEFQQFLISPPCSDVQVYFRTPWHHCYTCSKATPMCDVTCHLWLSTRGGRKTFYKGVMWLSDHCW